MNGSSGQVLQQLCAFARASVRTLSGPRLKLPRTSSKMSLDAGLDDYSARSVRHATWNARWGVTVPSIKGMIYRRSTRLRRWGVAFAASTER